MDIERILKEIIIVCREDICRENINTSTNLILDLGFDSVDIIQLVCEIENTFSIEIDDENLEVEKIGDFSELCKIIMYEWRKKYDN